MRDKYNLNTLPASLACLDDYEMDEHIVIPGMGIEEPNNEFDDPEINDLQQQQQQPDILDNNSNSGSAEIENGVIPGLDHLDLNAREKKPFTKPIPKNFQAQWNVDGVSKNDMNKPNVNNVQDTSVNKLDNVMNVVAKVIERMPDVIKFDNSRSDRVLVYNREMDIKRELQGFY
jgi:polyadenylation factor subunit 2